MSIPLQPAMTNPPISAYTPNALTVCERTLRTVVSHLGCWGPKLALVGGLTPRFLIPKPPEGIADHIGTTDLDLVLSVCLSDDDQTLYRELEEALRAANFAPSFDPKRGRPINWRWERAVGGATVYLEFLCPPAEGGTPGHPLEELHPLAGKAVAALQMPGADLVFQDAKLCVLEGDTLDAGGETRVELLVANMLPFLVLKAFAIKGREKDKDAYDTVWVLNASGESGPVDAAALALRSPIAGHPNVAAALAELAWSFETTARRGPMRYARFFVGPTGQDELRARLALDARATVRRFLDAYDAGSAAAVAAQR